jgi:hypothetical protein
MDWYSPRFKRAVTLTRHARERMQERQVSTELMQDLVENGQARYKDDTRLWLFQAYPERQDNLLCAAVVLEDSLVIKTVMHHWLLEDEA